MRGVLEVQFNAKGVGSIQLDGRDISGAVQGVDIKTRAGKPTEVALHLLVIELNSEADVQLFLSDETRELLTRYGWTPPPETKKGVLQ